MKSVLLIILCFCGHSLRNILSVSSFVVEEAFIWNTIEYEDLPIPSDSNIGPFKYNVPENTLITSFGYHPESDVMIVNFLRKRPGVPLALGVFCTKDYALGSNAKIWSFPNVQSNILKASDFEGGEKNTDDIQRIISVFHLTIDEKCNRVFFVDNGLLDYIKEGTFEIVQPTLWVLNLPPNGCVERNFPLIRKVEIPDSITKNGKDGFMHVILNYQPSGSCDDLFLYITNTFNSYLVVYDYKNDEFWRFDHETFQPKASEANFIFEKKFNYQMLMGIISVALEAADTNGDQIAYYTSLTGTDQYSVSTKILNDKSKTSGNYGPNDFKFVGNRGENHQSLKTVIDYSTNVMFYTEVQSMQVRCWNIKKPLNPDNMGVIYEAEDFDFAAQMFIDSNRYLWFHSTEIPIVFISDMPLDANHNNNQILRVKIDDAIKGTVCDG